MRTAQEIVDQTNELARRFYEMQGCEVPTTAQPAKRRSRNTGRKLPSERPRMVFLSRKLKEEIMRIIDVTYRTQVPTGMTDDEILEWLRYTMDERGEIADDNPMNGCGLEPHIRTIRFQDVTEEAAATTTA